MMKKPVILIFRFLLFVFALMLIVQGQKSISWSSLGQMFLGLFLLIFILYRYNQNYQ